MPTVSFVIYPVDRTLIVHDFNVIKIILSLRTFSTHTYIVPVLITYVNIQYAYVILDFLSRNTFFHY